MDAWGASRRTSENRILESRKENDETQIRLGEAFSNQSRIWRSRVGMWRLCFVASVEKKNTDVPGDSNMNVTTSPASSAFMVMMSSLSAHFSILDCVGKENRRSGTSGCVSFSRQGTDARGTYMTRLGDAHGAHRFVVAELTCSRCHFRRCARHPSLDLGNRPGPRRRPRFQRGVPTFSNNAFVGQSKRHVSRGRARMLRLVSC